MADVYTIHNGERVVKVNSDAVETLEKLLEVAKSGKMRSFAVSALVDGDIYSAWSIGKGDRRVELVGAVKVTETEMLSKLFEW